jgi:hypothetical protein
MSLVWHMLLLKCELFFFLNVLILLDFFFEFILPKITQNSIAFTPFVEKLQNDLHNTLLTYWGDFQQYQEHAPIFLFQKINFYFIEFFIEIYLLFNYFYTIDLNITKPL